MKKVLNIYETLNEREKYILKTLEVKEEWFEAGDIHKLIRVMEHMKNRLSQLPITREQIISAIDNYNKPHDKIFEGIPFITSDDDYPDITVNMYDVLSEESRKVVEMVGIKVENKEITSKEYAHNFNILLNKILIKYLNRYKRKRVR